METSRITRLHQVLGSFEAPTIEEHIQIQQDDYLLAAERDIPLFSGWVSSDPDIDWARDLIESWDAKLSKESTEGAMLSVGMRRSMKEPDILICSYHNAVCL